MIAEYRKRAGYNQAELAKALNVAQTTVSGWERGSREPDNKAITKLCKLLNTSYEALFYDAMDDDTKADVLLESNAFDQTSHFDYPEVLSISRIANKMNADQRRRMLTIIENAFPQETAQAYFLNQPKISGVQTPKQTPK
ncbi:MAG: helix-turn-helix transcriptional regulator [Oscillospiraceae bacterium]|jgi:transcriptional regulator with XRE-family HTH domain|nr:helix-turn-helix transcriptional regulator [Oscillospiraceae bacterium]